MNVPVVLSYLLTMNNTVVNTSFTKYYSNEVIIKFLDMYQYSTQQSMCSMKSKTMNQVMLF